MPEPLILKAASTDPDPPVFLRRVARARIWAKALETKQPSDASELLFEEDQSVSLWHVGNDEELRRVAMAINESRDSLRETLDLLPILPAELEEAGIKWISELGLTSCPTAAKLHYNAGIDDDARSSLLQKLIAQGRRLVRCTGGKLREAVELSTGEGCFAVATNSIECACGEKR